MDNDYCIVTGANAGIGKEVTAGLLARGANVVMACRNMEACGAAKTDLEQRGLRGSCTCSRLDLSDLQSVRSFAEEQRHRLRRQGQPLKVLVNNAGVMGVGTGPNGEDQHLAVNHLGPFLLTSLLLPDMAPGSRIVSVASRAARWGHVAVKDNIITPGARFWYTQYARSKLCNILFTAELQRRFQHSHGIIATSVSPGFVNTTIFRPFPVPVSWMLQKVMPLIGRTSEQVGRYAEPWVLRWLSLLQQAPACQRTGQCPCFYMIANHIKHHHRHKTSSLQQTYGQPVLQLSTGWVEQQQNRADVNPRCIEGYFQHT